MRRVWILVLAAACGEVGNVDPDARPADADLCTGTCECKVDTDCSGAHTVCFDETANRTCQCAAGYTRGVSGTCDWSGVVADPGFQAAARWTLAAGAAVDQNLNEAGMVDPGAARFIGAAGLCNLARMGQAFEMPRLSRAEPLVVEITHRFRAGFGPALPARPAFGIDATWTDQILGTGNPWQTARVCLGAGQYAPPASKNKGALVSLTLMPHQLSSPCNDPNTSLDIDHFEIKPANPSECPAPGTAANGDAEATGNWVFTAGNLNGNPVSSMIEAGAGEAGSRGVRMFARNRCSDTTATTRVSVPMPDLVASPALAFFNRTTTTANNVATDPRLGGIDLPAIGATGADQPQKLCIPAAMRGAVVDFRAAMNLSGTCADLVDATSIIDNVKIVDEPGCGVDAAVTDSGFESPLALIGASSTPGKSLARSLNDPTMAHSGNGALQLSVTQECDGPSWQANIVVPTSQTAGPSLTFFYKAPPANKYTFRVSATGATFTPTLNNQWNAGKICLNPKLAGRGQPVVFSMSAVGGHTCANVIPAETALVDDLAVATDPACPAM